MEKIYNVFAKAGEIIAEVEADLISEYGTEAIPERPVKIADAKPLIPIYTSFYLTEEEAEQVAKDPRVRLVAEPSKLKPIKMGSGSNKGEMIRFNPSLESGTGSDFITYSKFLEYLHDTGQPNTFAKAPLTNWALGRHKKFTDRHLTHKAPPWRPLEAFMDKDNDEQSTAVQTGQATATPREATPNIYALGTYGEDFSWEHDGEGVDIIILDTGVDANNPEWDDADGNSRFVRFDWNAEGMLSGESNIPPNFYRDYDGHGTHVASSAAGKQHGFAKGARIFAIPAIAHPHETGLADAVGACFFFCYRKWQAYNKYHNGLLTADTPNKTYLEEQIVADNGVARPTVINMSLGISFYVKEVTELTHKGTTHYVGQYNQDGDYVRDGDFTFNDLQRVFGLHAPDGALQLGQEDPEIQAMLDLLMYGLGNTTGDHKDYEEFSPHLTIASGNHSLRLDVNKNYKEEDGHDSAPDHEMLSDHFGQELAGQDWDNSVQAKFYFGDEDETPDAYYPHRPTSPWHPTAHMVGAIGSKKDNGLNFYGEKALDYNTYYNKGDGYLDADGSRGKFENKAEFSCHGPAVNTWAAGEEILAAQSIQHQINDFTAYRFTEDWGSDDEHILYYGDIQSNDLKSIAIDSLCPANTNANGMKIEFDTQSVSGTLRMYFRLTPEAIAAFEQEYEQGTGKRYPTFIYSGGTEAEYTGIRNIKTFLQWDHSKLDPILFNNTPHGLTSSSFIVNTGPKCAVSYDCPEYNEDDGQDSASRSSRIMYGVGTNTTSDIGEATAGNFRPYFTAGFGMLGVDFNEGRDLGVNDADYSITNTVIPEVTDANLEDRVFFEVSLPFSDLPSEYNPDHADYDPTTDLNDLFRCVGTFLNWYDYTDENIQHKIPTTQITRNRQSQSNLGNDWSIGYGAPWIRDFPLDDDASLEATAEASLKDANSYSMVFGSSQTVFSGTSMAAPHVAGMIACHLEKQPMSHREMLLFNTAGSDSSSTSSGIEESGEVGFPKDHLTRLLDFAGNDFYHIDGDHHWANWYGAKASDLRAHNFTAGYAHGNNNYRAGEYHAIIGPRNVVTTTDCRRENETKITGELFLHSDRFKDNSVLTYEFQTTPAVYGYLNENEAIDLNLVFGAKNYQNTSGMFEKYGKIPSRYVPQNIMDIDASWVPKIITGKEGISAFTTEDNKTFTASWEHTNPSSTAVTTATFNAKIFNNELDHDVTVNLLPQSPLLTNANTNNEITGSTYERHGDINGVSFFYIDYDVVGVSENDWTHLREVAQLAPNMPMASLTVNILEEDDYESFEINNDIIQFKDSMNNQIDYETKNYYQIKIQLNDIYGRSSPVYTVKIDVLDRLEILADIHFIPRDALQYNNSNTITPPVYPTYATVNEHEHRTHIYTIRARDPRSMPLHAFNLAPSNTNGTYQEGDDLEGTPFEIVTSTYTDANGDDWDQVDLYVTNVDYESGLNSPATYESDRGTVIDILGSQDVGGTIYNAVQFNWYAYTEDSTRQRGDFYLYIANQSIEPNQDHFYGIHAVYSNGGETYGGSSSFTGQNAIDNELVGFRPNCIRVDEGIKAGDVIATVSLGANDTDMFDLQFAPHPFYTGIGTLTNTHLTNSYNGVDYLAGDDFSNNVNKLFKHNDSDGNPYFEINEDGEIIATRDMDYDANDHTFNFVFFYATTYAPANWENDWNYKNLAEILVEVVDVDRTPHFVDDQGNTITTMPLDIMEHQDIGTVLSSFETAYPATIDYYLVNANTGSTYNPHSSLTTDPSGEFYLLLDDDGQPISGEVTSGNLAVASKWVDNFEGSNVQPHLGTITRTDYFIRLTATNSEGSTMLTITPTLLDDPIVDNIQLTLSVAQPMTIQNGDTGVLFNVTCNLPEAERGPYIYATSALYGSSTNIDGILGNQNGVVSLDGAANYSTRSRMIGSVRCQHLETGEWAIALIDVTVQQPALFTNTIRTGLANVYGSNFEGFYHGWTGFANGSNSRLIVNPTYYTNSNVYMNKFAYLSNYGQTQLEIGSFVYQGYIFSAPYYGMPNWSTIQVGNHTLYRSSASSWYNSYLDMIRYSWYGNFMPAYNTTTTMLWN